MTTTTSPSASPTPYVTLISNDGFEFILSRDAACVAGTIKKMLDPQKYIGQGCAKHECTGSFAESISGRCTLGTINGVVLEKVCEYLCYNLKHKDEKDVPDMEIPPELCLELLMAADYLHC